MNTETEQTQEVLRHTVPTTDIVRRCRILKEDHEPDGWPAIKMEDVTALCDEIERLKALCESSTSVDKYKAFTMYDWNETYRPELKIYDDVTASLYLGNNFLTEIAGDSKEDLKEQMVSYALIFAEAAKFLDA